MEGAGDNVELLLLGQLDKVDSVARDANGEVRVLLWVLNGVLEGGLVQHVDVGVVQTRVCLLYTSDAADE